MIKSCYKLPAFVKFLFVVFVIQMLFFTVSRGLFLWVNGDNVPREAQGYLFNALLLGYSFDLVVSSYTLILPFIGFSLLYFFNAPAKMLAKIAGIYFSILFILFFLIAATDIPFFKYFNSRLTTAVWLWIDNPLSMFKYILSEKVFYPYLFSFIFGAALLPFTIFLFRKRFFSNIDQDKGRAVKKVVLFVICGSLIFLAMRGGPTRLRPIGIKDAFISNFPFINQLSINPVHSYLYSMKLFTTDFMEDQMALDFVSRELKAGDSKDFPLARNVTFKEDPIRPNVVLVIMESLTASIMNQYGHEKNLTPFLDSLSRKGVNFTNVYSAGIHSCNGIFATLYGFPTLAGQHPFSNVSSITQDFAGLPGTLKKNNYETAFFCSHEPEFDNMEYFLTKNGYNQFYSRNNYPPEKMEGFWGVSDEFLFEFSLDKMNELAEKKKPFFSTILTISAHEPPSLPSKTTFKPKSSLPLEQVYEYADWCIENFITACSKQNWFENTLFVFVADHGINYDAFYEMPLSFHHIPLLLYAPGILKNDTSINKPALQIDVFPTVMGVLKAPYINNSMGVDLLTETRRYAYFSADNKMGCISDSLYWIKESFGRELLYNYRKKEKVDLMEQYISVGDSMKNYTYSMLQATQWLLDNKKAGSLIIESESSKQY